VIRDPAGDIAEEFGRKQIATLGAAFAANRRMFVDVIEPRARACGRSRRRSSKPTSGQGRVSHSIRANEGPVDGRFTAGAWM
jgi:hypothetical protein